MGEDIKLSILTGSANLDPIMPMSLEWNDLHYTVKLKDPATNTMVEADILKGVNG